MGLLKTTDADTKEKILSTALHLISNNPNHRVSVSELKRETGLSTGSFYHFFPKGADDIAHDLYVLILGDLKNSILLGTDSISVTHKFIHRCVDNFFNWHLNHPTESTFLNTQADIVQSERGALASQLKQQFAIKLTEKLTTILTKEFPRKKFELRILIPAFFGSCQEYIKSWHMKGRPSSLIKDAKSKMADFLYAGLIG
ncbi:MAG: TetR/AcrR family transcriptional regulator [Xanthomonadaceae bacterium]|nr:TetR/AcrR family transcriptional regulator [Xanthomonadaceae bacterium]